MKSDLYKYILDFFLFKPYFANCSLFKEEEKVYTHVSTDVSKTESILPTTVYISGQ